MACLLISSINPKYLVKTEKNYTKVGFGKKKRLGLKLSLLAQQIITCYFVPMYKQNATNGLKI